MSFSHEVKKELAKHMSNARHCQLAELAAILHFCGQIGANGSGEFYLGIQSENEFVLQKCFTLLKKTVNIEAGVFQKEEDIQRITQLFGRFDEPVSSLLLKSSCCQRAFLRGAFLCVGSMSDPEKGYHLEFVCMDEQIASQLQEVMLGFGIEAKIILRKKYPSR